MTTDRPTADDGETLTELYESALNAMATIGPTPLGVRVAFEAQLRQRPDLAESQALAAYIDQAAIGDRLLSRLRLALAKWDADPLGTWSDGTAPRTAERRQRIYERLELDETLRETFDAAMPVAKDEAVVVSRQFQPWYGRVMAERQPFYWAHYAEYLAARGWHEDGIAALDLNTTRVVERLADPERIEAYQAKGLVVGYVQSGKTANFTGVLSKAIDAGYRLLIVLTGTTDLLRAQTQRRLDKELVGKDNLLRGIDPDDHEGLLSVDYHSDPDWSEFVAHGALPSMVGAPDTFRLTTHQWDYRSLKQGISSLDFERRDPAKPLNARENLPYVPARLLVVKKNPRVLERFVSDLRRITARLADIPAVIIDDESDQASINTSNPDRWAKGRTERTRINGLISQLLELLPRGQYIGYTATPFANVFVDPSDAVDIFPRDFILSLDRPPGYMGPSDFHDLDSPDDEETEKERNLANSNELAYVRPVTEDETHAALQEAIDAFIVSGSIKLFRERQGSEALFRHHTMLVHESVRQAEHKQLADVVRSLWKEGGYYAPSGLGRLRDLFEADFLPIMQAREGDEPIPDSFNEIKPFIGEVVSRIGGSTGDPVLIVNGDKEAASEEVDFENRPVWRILVGGQKLSRGFTVEGLTISYYRRVTRQQDTLMQMGRWFGYRRGYRDLVRLYIRRGTVGARDAYDLYQAFEAACRSEQLFRAELEKYARTKDGVPEITPVQVPPLVGQHLGWLRPSAGNKMYNARLVERRSPGERLEPVGYPEDPEALAANTRVLAPLVEAASLLGSFSYPTSGGSRRTYPAWYGTIAHHRLLRGLEAMRWQPADHFAADLTWLQSITADQLEDWVVLMPQHVGTGPKASVLGRDSLSVFRRQRRRHPLFGAISDPKHRHAASRIAGVDPAAGEDDTDGLRRGRRGAVLLYPMVEMPEDQDVPSELGPGEIVLACVFVAPTSTGSPDGALVQFVVRDRERADEPIVDRTEM